MGRFRAAAACAVLAFIVVAWSSRSPVAAQGNGSTPAPQIWTGVYTPAQAEEGAIRFGAMCSRCHGNDLSGGQVGAAFAPALGGNPFLQAWESRPVTRLFLTIRETMPRGAAGVLTDDAALELVAYILKFNGFPSGTGALTPDQVKLNALLIVPKEGLAVRDVADFAVVQASGCLTRGSATSWMLTDASAPAIVRTGAEVSRGTQAYRLVSTAPFHLDAHAGEAVTVKGLLRRDPDEVLLNLTAVEPSGVRCR